jgi:H+/gluconate symporter-like permease
MTALGIIGIILGLVVLVYGSMKGFSVFISAIVASIIIGLFGGTGLQQALLTDFMTGLVNFVKGNFMVFAAGALMGKVYEITFGAKAVARLFIKLFGARFAPFAVLAAIWVMTWGGIAGFVLAFSVFPIALEVFKEANLPRHIIPGLIISGCTTASSWGPGVAQPVNNIMASGFGVPLTAAFAPSVLMAIASMATAFGFLYYFIKQAKAKGEQFISADWDATEDVKNLPNGWVALVPIIVALLLINVKIGGTVILPVAFGVFVGAVLAYILMYKYRTESQPITNHIGQGFQNALISIGNTAAMVAVGTVAQSTESFQVVMNGITGLGGNPLISVAIAGLAVSSITGGATGATGLLAPILAPIYSGMGVNMEMVGRIVITAGHVGGTLPNCGFVNTVISGIARDTYDKSYKYSFFLATAASFVALVVGVIVMAAMGVYA